MAGHSKWHNRVHRKMRQDAKKGALYSRMAREIMMAAKEGADPTANFRLRVAIEKAREAGVPADNIERAIRRGSGQEEGIQYEELTYEGYGPGGVAIIMEIMTDNRNRTAGEIRHLFSRHGGSLAESGAVAWMFERKGLLTLKEAPSLDEETLLMDAAEAGAEDVQITEEGAQVVTAPEDLARVREALSANGYDFSDASLVMMPTTTVEPENEEDIKKAVRLLQALEDHEDVQHVFTNLSLSDEAWEKVEA
ncbi:MAG: YebC/PmpR family DNA-binding transcriptional regulator [Bacillota bacterium]|nr:YebC/PmpR family DNA-binding transcriptional regulator [Bacillota bacterium]